MANNPAPDEPVVHDETHMTRTEFEKHEQTYTSFLRLTKWAIALIVIALIFMGLFLT